MCYCIIHAAGADGDLDHNTSRLVVPVADDTSACDGVADCSPKSLRLVENSTNTNETLRKQSKHDLTRNLPMNHKTLD